MTALDVNESLTFGDLPDVAAIYILDLLSKEDLCCCIFAFATEPSLKEIVAYVRDKWWLGKMTRPEPFVFIMSTCLAQTREDLRFAASPRTYELVSAKIKASG